jgi:hypothetical protein
VKQIHLIKDIVEEADYDDSGSPKNDESKVCDEDTELPDDSRPLIYKKI